MKKIITGIAALAMLTSVFAVDFTAGFQLKGEVLNYDGGTKNINVFKLAHENTKDDKPFIFSISTDKVGGTLKFYDNSSVKFDTWNDKNYDGKVDAGETSYDAQSVMMANYWNIWFKPLDMLKVDLGNHDTKLNCESITYWMGKVLGTSDWGIKATFSFDALSISAMLNAGNGAYWASKPNKGDFTFGETALYASYGADFGTISALFVAKDTFKNIAIGAGYKNTFGSITMFADAAFNYVDKKADAYKNDTRSNLAVDADVKYAQDALSAEAYVKWFASDIENIKKDTMDIMLQAKVGYNVSGGTVYVKFVDKDVLDFLKKSNLDTLELGFDGYMGAMSYNIAAKVSSSWAGKINFSVPFWVRLGF